MRERSVGHRLQASQLLGIPPDHAPQDTGAFLPAA
jgi:hypothetical protein